MIAFMAHYLAILQPYQLCNIFMEIGVMVAQNLFEEVLAFRAVIILLSYCWEKK